MTSRGVLIKKSNRSTFRTLEGACLAVAVFLTVVLQGSGAIQAREQAPEYQIKAAYIYNFILFASWPEAEPPFEAPSEQKNIITCILGRDPFGNHFKNVEGKEIEPGKVLQVDRRDSVSDP